MFEDKFPDVTSHLKVEGIELVFPKTIDEVLDRAGVFAKRDNMLDENITITLENRKLTVSSKSDEGWFKEDVNSHYEGEKVEFNITPYLLKSILKETQSSVLGNNKLKFSGEDWEYMTALRG